MKTQEQKQTLTPKAWEELSESRWRIKDRFPPIEGRLQWKERAVRWSEIQEDLEIPYTIPKLPGWLVQRCRFRLRSVGAEPSSLNWFILQEYLEIFLPSFNSSILVDHAGSFGAGSDRAFVSEPYPDFNPERQLEAFQLIAKDLRLDLISSNCSWHNPGLCLRFELWQRWQESVPIRISKMQAWTYRKQERGTNGGDYGISL